MASSAMQPWPAAPPPAKIRLSTIEWFPRPYSNISNRSLDVGDSLHTGRKNFFHQIRPATAARRYKLAAAVGPDWIRDASKRHQAFIVALLVSIVDSLAGKDFVAVVFVRADRA